MRLIAALKDELGRETKVIRVKLTAVLELAKPSRDSAQLSVKGRVSLMIARAHAQLSSADHDKVTVHTEVQDNRFKADTIYRYNRPDGRALIQDSCSGSRILGSVEATG